MNFATNSADCNTPSMVFGINRLVLRYERRKDSEDQLRADLIRLASRFGRYGCRRIHALFQVEGWKLNPGS